MDTPFPYVQLHESTNLLRPHNASGHLLLFFLLVPLHLSLLLHNHSLQVSALLVLRLDRLDNWAQVWFILLWFSLFACW